MVRVTQGQEIFRWGVVLVGGQIEIKRFGLVDENREPKNRRLPWFILKGFKHLAGGRSKAKTTGTYAPTTSTQKGRSDLP